VGYAALFPFGESGIDRVQNPGRGNCVHLTVVGQLSGIRDKYGHELAFPAAFRLSRAGQPKGVIKIGATS
jgi:hypothetical protein